MCLQRLREYLHTAIEDRDVRAMTVRKIMPHVGASDVIFMRGVTEAYLLN